MSITLLSGDCRDILQAECSGARQCISSELMSVRSSAREVGADPAKWARSSWQPTRRPRACGRMPIARVRHRLVPGCDERCGCAPQSPAALMDLDASMSKTNPFAAREAADRRAAHYANGRPVLDSTDALLQAVLDMAHQVAELRALVAELREEIRGKPSVVMFPSNALRHSR
jgi:hypothetical protein